MGRAPWVAWLASRAPLFAVFALLAIPFRWFPAALYREVVGPAVIAVALATMGSGHFSRSVHGWPRVPFRSWARAWMEFLGLLGVTMVFAIAVVSFVLTGGGWRFAFALLRFVLVALGGALALAAAARLLARRGPTACPPACPP